MSAKRRLPVLGPTADSHREGAWWHWMIATAALSFALWLPLVLVALWFVQWVMARRAVPTDTSSSAWLVVGLLLASFLVASALGAGVVRGFASRARAVDSAVGGLLAALISCLVAAMGGSLSPWPVALVSAVALGLSGIAGGALGGWLGRSWAIHRSARVDPPSGQH